MRFLILIFSLALTNLCICSEQVDTQINKRLMWIDNAEPTADTHVAFRGWLCLDDDSDVQLQLCGASWYCVWIDGVAYTEGPDRYHPSYPEYQVRNLSLKRGKHTIAVQVHYQGIETRMQKIIKPFLYLSAKVNNIEIPIAWRCDYLRGYISQGRRIIGSLGWIEWCDVNNNPTKWQLEQFDDSGWREPVFVDRGLGEFSASRIAPVKMIAHKPEILAQGELAEIYGVFNDMPGSTFFTRDIECKIFPAV